MNDVEKALRGELRSAERQLGPAVEARLRAARERACAQPVPRKLASLWLPVSGVALASVVFAALLFSPLSPLPGGSHSTSSFPETVQAKELDFYYWLAETQNGLDS
ncbi:MAG: hypothetical protein WC997_12055 [Porticoccaceae bacterium]